MKSGEVQPTPSIEQIPPEQQATPTSQPTPEIPKTKSSFLKMLSYMLLAIVFMAVGALGFWVYQEQFLKKDTDKPESAIIPTQPPTSAPTSTESPATSPAQPSPTTNWQVFNFDVWKDRKYSVSYPKDWNLDTIYAEKEMLGEDAEVNKYVAWVKISKNGYVFRLYFPTAFGMDFCFYPESEPNPPFYEGPEGFDFMTLKEYEKIDSQYAKYVRGKIPLPETLDGVDKYYLTVCNREQPQSSIFMGFVRYYLPTDAPDEQMLSIMDDILKTYHQLQ